MNEIREYFRAYFVRSSGKARNMIKLLQSFFELKTKETFEIEYIKDSNDFEAFMKKKHIIGLFEDKMTSCNELRTYTRLFQESIIKIPKQELALVVVIPEHLYPKRFFREEFLQHRQGSEVMDLGLRLVLQKELEQRYDEIKDMIHISKDQFETLVKYVDELEGKVKSERLDVKCIFYHMKKQIFPSCSKVLHQEEKDRYICNHPYCNRYEKSCSKEIQQDCKEYDG